jgi:hypothetical protein
VRGDGDDGARAELHRGCVQRVVPADVVTFVRSVHARDVRADQRRHGAGELLRSCCSVVGVRLGELTPPIYYKYSIPTDNCPQPKETLPAVSTLTLPY